MKGFTNILKRGVNQAGGQTQISSSPPAAQAPVPPERSAVPSGGVPILPTSSLSPRGQGGLSAGPTQKTTNSPVAQVCVAAAKLNQTTEANREAESNFSKCLARAGAAAKKEKDEQTKQLGEVYSKASDSIQKIEEARGELATKFGTQFVDSLTDVLATSASFISKDKDPIRNNQSRQIVMLIDCLELYQDFFTKGQEAVQSTLAALRPYRESAAAAIAHEQQSNTASAHPPSSPSYGSPISLNSSSPDLSHSSDDNDLAGSSSPTKDSPISHSATHKSTPHRLTPLRDLASPRPPPQDVAGATLSPRSGSDAPAPNLIGVDSVVVNSEKPQRAYDSETAGPINRLHFSEFLAEEMKFAGQMEQIMEKFYRPFKEDEKLAIRIFPEDYDNIFMYIEKITVLSLKNIADLQKFHREWPMPNPGAYLYERMKGFDLFVNYAGNYGNLVFSLKRAKKLSRSVKQYMFEVLIDDQITLGMALSHPLKVIPRWTAFIESLPPATDPQDAQSFAAIRAKLKEFSIQQATHMKLFEVVLQVHEVQGKIQGFTEMLAQPDRRFIREISALIKPEGVPVQLFLFNDMLIEAKPPQKTLAKNLGKKVKYRFSRKIMLRRVRVTDAGAGPESAFRIQEGNNTDIIYGVEANLKASWIQDIQESIANLNRDTVFGIPLEELMNEREKGRDIPLVVEKTINFLITKGLTTEGLFRVCGSQKRIDDIRDLFDNAMPVEFDGDNEMEIHAVAGILKLWIRSLPEPLMNFYDEFIETNRSGLPLKEKLEKFRSIIERFPRNNKYILQHLMSFCELIASHSESNKMTSSNMSIVIGPNILYKSNRDTMDYAAQAASMGDQKDITDIVQNLIDHYDDIFSGIEAERRREKQRQQQAPPRQAPPSVPHAAPKPKGRLPPAPAASLPAPPPCKAAR